ncbi:GNAT family N-acetyltransferase [Clostridium akagii]|uniref:GNAT family N-acetyltransferase n=1 Tax=Clostridium akagii TaxID=91623 RepID=UPI00047CEC77|nr:GNAT family N-acetyltransferase [Clostridium akagii]
MRMVAVKKGLIITVRKVLSEDINGIMEYMKVIGGESDNLTFGAGEWDVSFENELTFIENINTENSVMLVAVANGEIAGSASFSAGGRSRTQHVGELGITVRKSYWNLGVGSVLLEEIITWAKSTNIIRKINLRVRTDNINGIKLYRKYGFKEEGNLSRDFCINGIFFDSMTMGLEID